MDIKWRRSKVHAQFVNGSTDTWICDASNTNKSTWALYKMQDQRWHLYFWRLRGESWDTLEEAKTTSAVLYRMGHFDQWNPDN